MKNRLLLPWLILVLDFHLGYVQFCLTWRSICCNFLGAGFMFHIGQVVGLYVSAMFLYICQLCWLFTIYIFQALFCTLSIHCCRAKCRYTFWRTIEEMFVALNLCSSGIPIHCDFVYMLCKYVRKSIPSVLFSIVILLIKFNSTLTRASTIIPLYLCLCSSLYRVFPMSIVQYGRSVQPAIWLYATLNGE